MHAQDEEPWRSSMSNPTRSLHRLLTEWSEMIPAEFDIYPLLDADAAVQFLNEG